MVSRHSIWQYWTIGVTQWQAAKLIVISHHLGKSANIIAIPKSGTSERLDKFRPMSLLQVVAKVFERLVQQWLGCLYSPLDS